ncbi:hypothetical protein EBZ39_16215 [bacterium]|nr:hypothetical protein [bacterium]
MRWQDMPDGKEKYAAYLCSREWSVLKEAVRDRSGGVCERCNANAMDHVHHLTYARKYGEKLDDLQACCKACHKFLHGKCNSDPVRDRHLLVPWCGTPVKSFYLAGKITGTTWRDSIVPGWSEQNHSCAYLSAFFEYEVEKTWATVPNACSVLGAGLDFTGPWWQDTDSCGHSTSGSSSFPHGYGSQKSCSEVLSAVQSAITRSDMVFAWIDSGDCYGTIYEIGYAKALGKLVAVGISEDFCATPVARDMWLSCQGSYNLPAKTPLAAWNQFWTCVEFELLSDPSTAKALSLHYILKTKRLDAQLQAELLEKLVYFRRVSRTKKEATDGAAQG